MIRAKLFLMTVIILLSAFVMPCSCSANETTADFQVMFTAGAAVDEELGAAVWKPTSSAKGHRFSYQITYQVYIPNGTSIEQGKLRFILPACILTTRDGNRGNLYEMSIPSWEQALNDPSNIDSQTFLAYWEEDNSIIISNFKELPAANYTGYLQIAYYTNAYTFDYVDDLAGGSLRPRYQANLEFTDKHGMPSGTCMTT